MKKFLSISLLAMILAITFVPASAGDGHILIGGKSATTNDETGDEENEPAATADGHILIGGRNAPSASETIYFWTLVNLENIFRI